MGPTCACMRNMGPQEGADCESGRRVRSSDDRSCRRDLDEGLRGIPVQGRLGQCWCGQRSMCVKVRQAYLVVGLGRAYHMLFAGIKVGAWVDNPG